MSWRSIAVVVLAALACPAFAYAYVDPGAGSMLLQLLLGGLAGLLVFGKLLKHRLFRLLGLGKDRDNP